MAYNTVRMFWQVCTRWQMIYQMLKVFNCIRWSLTITTKKSNNDVNSINNSNSCPNHCFFQLYVVGVVCQILIEQHLFMIFSNLQLRVLNISTLKWVQCFPQVLRTCEILQNLMQGEASVNKRWTIGGLKHHS